MIPLRDNVRSRTFPAVTLLFIVLNALAFVFELQLGHSLENFIQTFGFVPLRYFGWMQAGGSVLDPWRYVPLVSAMFLHGGWLHIAGNMLFLWIFGDNVEDRLGHGRFFLFYLLCGVGAFYAQGLVDPSSRIPAVGASGAIAGVLGAYLVLYPRARVLTVVPIFIFPWFVEIPALVFLGIWFAMQLLSGTAALTPGAGAAAGVAWWAHAAGFLIGMALCLLLRRPPRAWEERPWAARRSRGLWSSR